MFICQICLKQYSYKDKFDAHVERCVSERRSRGRSAERSVERHIPERSPERRSSTSSPSIRRSVQPVKQQYQMIDSLLEDRSYTVENVSPMPRANSPPREMPSVVPTRITIHTQNVPPSDDIVKRMRQIHAEMKEKYQQTVNEMKETEKKNEELKREIEKKNEEFIVLKEKAIRMTTLFKNTLIKQKEDYDSKMPLKSEQIVGMMKRNEELEKQRYDVELLKTQFSSLLESQKNRYENEISELKKEIAVLKER